MLEPMRYAAFFGLLGVSFLLLAAQAVTGEPRPLAWGVAGLEGYCAVSLLTLAAAYALQHRGTAVENAFEHSAWRPWLDILLFPYRILAWVVAAALRRVDSMGPMHAVGTRLYVGRLPRPSDRQQLAEAGVTSVLNLCIEFPVRPRWRRDEGVETVYLPLLDGAAPSHRQFQEALDWIVRRHADGHTVLIHCAQGRGRSVTVAAAALCRLGLAAGPEDALAAIRSARPKAKPSRQQQNALARFVQAVQPAEDSPPPSRADSLS